MQRASSRAVWTIGRTLRAALFGISYAWFAAADRPAFAVSGRIACYTRAEPGSGVDRGPCLTPDAVDYFPAGADGRGIVVTNFGLLVPGERSTSWHLVCDDNFGLARPAQIRLHPDGRIFAPSLEGLFASADTCGWSSAADIGMNAVFDVSFDRQQPNVLALRYLPHTLLRSSDGGKTFAVLNTFADSQLFHRVVVAPSDGKRVYLIGRGRGASTPFARSSDGGQTFEFTDLAMAANPPPGNPLEFVAADPDNRSILYFYVINATYGDELWRTTDGGQTLAKILSMTDAEAFSGFSFGASPQTLYAAGSDPFPLGDKPPARLYVSRDGGRSWEPPITSSQEGPRYRCLNWSGGKLYACGAGEPGGDQFLVGASSDEGKTWTPAVKLRQVEGAKSCVQSRCLDTEEWLCENYCYCAPGTQPSSGICLQPGMGGTPDAGARDGGTDALPMASACVGTACAEKQGWCAVAGRSPPTRAPWLLGLALLLLALRRSFHVRRGG
jgi:photosystem II stability/assembly factor-like uncharacterized protein